MPLLDVTDVLTDPDFADCFTVTRATETVSSGGVGSATTAVTPSVSGVVTAAGTRELQRLPEGSILTGAITIHTIFVLTSGAGSQQADVVTWNGADYTAANVDDYSRFGAGFVSATCTLKPLN